MLSDNVVDEGDGVGDDDDDDDEEEEDDDDGLQSTPVSAKSSNLGLCANSGKFSSIDALRVELKKHTVVACEPGMTTAAQVNATRW